MSHYRRPPPQRPLTQFLATLLGIGLIALAAATLLWAGTTLDDQLTVVTNTRPTSPRSISTPVATTSDDRSTGPFDTPEPDETPIPVDTPEPDPTPALDPPPTAGPFAMNLYGKGDFVSEATKQWCVPAAMQTMINIMSQGSDRTTKTQKNLYALARRLSPKTLKGAGAEPEGWARGLNELGVGPYAVNVQKSRAAAIKAAAKALRMTGRPVGLLTWRGAHSWVMSGFKATADPAVTDSYTVTDVYIEDVWYPRVSTIWGPSRPPNSLVAVSALPEDYLPWRRPTRKYPDKDGKFVLVIPTNE